MKSAHPRRRLRAGARRLRRRPGLCRAGHARRARRRRSSARQRRRSTATAPDDDWWRLYRDPVLDGLVADALAANTDIRVAVARLDTRARVAARRADRPRCRRRTSARAATYGARLATPEPARRSTARAGTVDVGLDVSYEVDLFGRVRRTSRRRAAMSARRRPMPMRCASRSSPTTTRAYVDAASAAERLAVARADRRPARQVDAR